MGPEDSGTLAGPSHPAPFGATRLNLGHQAVSDIRQEISGVIIGSRVRLGAILAGRGSSNPQRQSLLSCPSPNTHLHHATLDTN
jgi:hypothetical protein